MLADDGGEWSVGFGAGVLAACTAFQAMGMENTSKAIVRMVAPVGMSPMGEEELQGLQVQDPALLEAADRASGDLQARIRSQLDFDVLGRAMMADALAAAMRDGAKAYQTGRRPGVN